MESAKQGSSETSSEENIIDRQEQQVKRSYECSFCKRGFTNAQALGGHMNIHRKDRANNKSKGKQLASSSSVSSKAANEENKNPRFMTSPTISSIDQATKYYPVLEAERINCETYFQPQGPSPGRRQPCNYHNHIGLSHDDHDFLVPNSQSLSMNEQLWGASLSLQIGSTNAQDHSVVNRRSIPEYEYDDDHEVDLELRLGNDRKWIS